MHAFANSVKVLVASSLVFFLALACGEAYGQEQAQVKQLDIKGSRKIDEVIVFHQLSKNELCKIVDLMLAHLQLQLAERKISLAVDESAKDFLINRGFDPTLGARPLRRAIQRYVEDPLAEEVLKGRFTEGGILRVTLEGDALTFEEVSLLEASK